MGFHQTPPTLGNEFENDRVLASTLRRLVDPETLAAITPSLAKMGALVGGELYRLQLEDLRNEPKLVQWDAWGHRVDQIEVSPLWKRAARIAAEEGLIAIPYEQRHGAASRLHQFALVQLFQGSSDVYTCPLAMTDGAAKTLKTHQNAPLVARALPRLTSRDPDTAWTSGQWMTERTGGSDVAISETVARRDGDVYRLYGTKWFTSATTSQMALTLARPDGAPSGGRGLALFYLERALPDGSSNGILVNRLKDKLGTRKVPTAELTLDGTVATPVVGLEDGIRNISPMLNVTRTWNAVCACGDLRRGLALARSYAERRVAFGAPLSHKPLHTDTLAGLQAEYEAASALTFRTVHLLGHSETRELDAREADLLRLITPLAKLTTGKQAANVTSEIAECFGGAGYVEDTGIPRLVRDAQVLPIWEGTTNVLSLDVLKVIGKGEALAAYDHELTRAAADVRDADLVRCAAAARAAFTHARAWLMQAFAEDRQRLEAGARRFALTLGRSLALALLVEHAQWSIDRERDGRPRAAALRFLRNGVDRVADASADEAGDAALARDEWLPA
jgi:acyl-CoA dehydrogenase